MNYLLQNKVTARLATVVQFNGLWLKYELPENVAFCQQGLAYMGQLGRIVLSVAHLTQE